MKEASIVPYDCIVVGAGPAGITASIYLARKNLDVLVLTLDVGGQAKLSTDVENYTGFTMIPGSELVKRFEEHLNAFNVKVINERVKAVRKEDELFKVETQENVYWAKSVIIASGKKPRSLGVPGEERLVGKGVIYSTLFNAPFFKDKPVAVVGGGNSAMQAILELSKVTQKIYVINIAQDLTGDEILKEKIKKMGFVKIFNDCKVVEIKGASRVEGIEVENVKTKERFGLEVKGVIVLIGLVPSLDFELPDGLKINERNEIDVDQNCCTNIPGLFAAGDVTDVKWKQIIIAAGEGAKAALSAYEYLMSKKEFVDGKF